MTATQAPTPGPLSVLAFHCESARLVPLLRKEAERLGKGVPTDLPSLHKDIWTAAEIIEQAEEAFAFTQKMDALAPTAPVEASGSVIVPVDATPEMAVAFANALEDYISARGWTSAKQVQGGLPLAPIWKTVLAALRPQPSGETREAVARLVDPGAWQGVYDVAVATGFVSDRRKKAGDIAKDILALLSARPLALGGQQGEVRETIVKTIAFLKRDIDTPRINDTVESLLVDLVKADAILRGEA